MVKIYLIPDKEHCIETVARREYDSRVRFLLGDSAVSQDLELELELLRGFLETADFGDLRRQSDEYLVQGKRIKFVIYREQGLVKYSLIPG